MTRSPFELFVFHRSYFCGKMMAYLRYKQIPHTTTYARLSDYGSTFMANTGLRQMPIVRTPDGAWLQDTTPMIEWFEQRFPMHAIVPDDPVAAFLCRLVEDYADEWMWRPAIYYRWAFDLDRPMYERLFPREYLGAPWSWSRPLTWVAGRLVRRHQHAKFLRGDGLSADNAPHVEQIYINALDRLERIFAQRPFLLGERPSLADFGFFGSMYYHFSMDPTPSRLMQDRAPGVFEWVARMWNTDADRVADGAWCELDRGVPVGWDALLDDVCSSYLPYLHSNARAFRSGRERMTHTIDGYTYRSMRVSPYRVWCRERLQAHLAELGDADRIRVRDVLASRGGWAPLTDDDDIRSAWDPDGIAPRCTPGTISLWRRLVAPVRGSNHVSSVRAWR